MLILFLKFVFIRACAVLAEPEKKSNTMESSFKLAKVIRR